MKICPIFLTMLALPFGALAQTAAPSCTPATVMGTHGLTLSGRDVSASVNLTKTFQSIGSATFDGVGAVTLNFTLNTNVAQGVTQTWSGTYTLPSSCVGTVTITSGDSATFTFIAYSGGTDFSLTGQDGTYALTGTGSLLPAACITSSLSGAYAFNGTGFSLSGTSVTGVNTLSGLLQFDGRGGVTANWSVATNGIAAADTLTGKYSITSQCQATSSVTDPSGASWNIGMVMTGASFADFAGFVAGPSSSFTINGHSTFTYPGLSFTSAASGAAAATPPGSIFALYGAGFTSGSSTQANTLPLPTALLSTSVSINSENAPLFYMGAGQVNAQMPWDAKPGLAAVTVTSGTTMSNTVAITVPAAATPAVFLYGSNRAIVQNADLSLNSASAPSKVGENVVAYFDGGGPVSNSTTLVSGVGSPAGLLVTGTPVVVTVGGATAKVLYIGLTATAVGLYQVNFTVPQVAAGDRNLVVSIGGVASAAALMTVSN